MESPFNKATLCEECPIGLFTSVKNAQPNCTTCRVGTVNSELGSLDCKDCPVGRTLITISPLNCLICPAGQYQPISGHLNTSVTCMSCNVGRFLEDPGLEDTKHATVDQCLTCPKGYEVNGTDITECVVCGYSKVSRFYIFVSTFALLFSHSLVFFHSLISILCSHEVSRTGVPSQRCMPILPIKHISS